MRTLAWRISIPLFAESKVLMASADVLVTTSKTLMAELRDDVMSDAMMVLQYMGDACSCRSKGTHVARY